MKTARARKPALFFYDTFFLIHFSAERGIIGQSFLEKEYVWKILKTNRPAPQWEL